MNVANLQGNTALHEVVRGGHLALVELLLRGGASPGIRNKRQRTPLDCAYELGGKVVEPPHSESENLFKELSGTHRVLMSASWRRSVSVTTSTVLTSRLCAGPTFVVQQNKFETTPMLMSDT